MDSNFNYFTAVLASIELFPFDMSLLIFICCVGHSMIMTGTNIAKLGGAAFVFCCPILIFIITYYIITFTGYHPYMIIPLTLCICLCFTINFIYSQSLGVDSSKHRSFSN